MPDTVLYEDETHKNVLLEDFGLGGLAVQANQHLIVHEDAGMILDPGGHKVYSKALSETMSSLAGTNLRYIFLSHQDPDIVAAVNGWLMTTDAEAYISQLWIRFVPHFGIDHRRSRQVAGVRARIEILANVSDVVDSSNTDNLRPKTSALDCHCKSADLPD